MRQGAALPLDRLLVFLVLSLADLLITILLLTSTPYAAEVIVVVVSAIGIYISVRRPETGRKVLTFACLVLGLVVIYSYRLLIHVI